MGREECCGEENSSSAQRPSKYVPSEDMGDYEILKRGKTPKKKSGALYPLSEEGSYGPPPASAPRSRALPGYQKRDRKLKVYASYAVDSDCSAHSHALSKNEAERGRSPPKPARRRATMPPERRAPPQTMERKGSLRHSQANRRSSSTKSPSPAPSMDKPASWQNSLRSSSVQEHHHVQRKASRRESKSPGHERARKSPSPAPAPAPAPVPRPSSQGRRSMSREREAMDNDLKYKSYSQFTAERHKKSSSASFETVKSGSVAKKSSEKYSEVREGGLLSSGDKSFDKDSLWDSMGVLGLSSKMFSVSSSEERFNISSSILRKQSVTSHAM